VLRDVAFIKAGLAYYETGGQFDGRYNNVKQLKKVSIDKKEEVVKELSTLVSHDLILRKLCLDFAPRRRTTRELPGYAHQKEIAKVLGKQLEIPSLNTDELAKMTAIITTRGK
jgi:hypothetical protein